jgi:hypothetical protein
MFTKGSVGGMITCGPAVAYLLVRAAVVSSLVGEMTACEPAGAPLCGMFTCKVVSGMFSCEGGDMLTCRAFGGMFRVGVVACLPVRSLVACFHVGTVACLPVRSLVAWV